MIVQMPLLRYSRADSFDRNLNWVGFLHKLHFSHFMCGIAIVKRSSLTNDQFEDLQRAIKRRGPDSYGEHEAAGFTLMGSVLSIQGTALCTQPYIDSEGNVLLWNGEIFHGLEADSESTFSDTVLIANGLLRCHQYETSIQAIAARITAFLSLCQGPFAFVYYIAALEFLFVGRDPFGRRSLLTFSATVDEDGKDGSWLGISSVGTADSAFTWNELSVEGIFHQDCGSREGRESSLVLQEWPKERLRLGTGDGNFARPLLGPEEAANRFLAALTLAVNRRVHCIRHRLPAAVEDSIAPLLPSSPPCPPPSSSITPCTVGVLFSGGIDSVLLAAVLSKVLPARETIDLINVTFLSSPASLTADDESPSPDRVAAIAAFLELKVSCLNMRSFTKL